MQNGSRNPSKKERIKEIKQVHKVKENNNRKKSLIKKEKKCQSRNNGGGRGACQYMYFIKRFTRQEFFYFCFYLALYRTVFLQNESLPLAQKCLDAYVNDTLIQRRKLN